MSQRVLICGDRNWTNFQVIADTLSKVYAENGVEVVIEGGAKGADTMGAQAAALLGIPVLMFPAQWMQYGKQAGPIRNRKLLTEGKPTLVLAFHNYIENSKGTKDMVNAAKKAMVDVRVITEKSHEASK